ncbi:sugar ABC transporter substrate-binding protein [Butyrivibrio sp. X503]|uniref:sugar ABC transporter substrate-binding protein n=1 Tax=Butyrivibrio sp. X503 TaxID=2364878 RepID=UPI000EAA592B|nr:substrate-binding domain-containing protein [Butyrivibrio sp. X503]RKM55467.1 sugar ABC transporter substrate-binding protein [Butyrivibrio sp. X503]
MAGTLQKNATKLISVFLTFILTAFCLFGCDSENAENSASNDEYDDKIQIGMCFDSFVIERWQRDRDVFVSMAKELGAEVNVQNANGDIEEQKKQIDYFIKKGMDAIVIICIDSGALSESVKKARDEGIVVIAYDRLINDANVDLYISFDNEMVGNMMAQSFVDAGLGDGKVIMICGSPSDNNVPQVESGFRDVLARNGGEVIDCIYCDGWKSDIAYEYMSENMDTVREADAIMCGNDDLASRVVHALAERRLAGKKMVAGQDADLEACQRIVEGSQLMTVYKPIEKLAKQAAVSAVELVKNRELSDSNISQINDGSYDVPYMKIEPQIVTEENINDVIINSGFHLKEDVYLNVRDKMPQ